MDSVTEPSTKVKQVSHNNSTRQAAANPYAGKVSVVGIYPTHQAGNIKAFATIKIGEALEIRGVKIIQQPGQKPWVALPDRPRTDGQGYAAIVKALDERLAEEISHVVLLAWQTGGAA